MINLISQPPYCNCVYNIKDKVWDVQIYFNVFELFISFKYDLSVIIK